MNIIPLLIKEYHSMGKYFKPDVIIDLIELEDVLTASEDSTENPIEPIDPKDIIPEENF